MISSGAELKDVWTRYSARPAPLAAACLLSGRAIRLVGLAGPWKTAGRARTVERPLNLSGTWRSGNSADPGESMRFSCEAIRWASKASLVPNAFKEGRPSRPVIREGVSTKGMSLSGMVCRWRRPRHCPFPRPLTPGCTAASAAGKPTYRPCTNADRYDRFRMTRWGLLSCRSAQDRSPRRTRSWAVIDLRSLKAPGEPVGRE